MATNSRWVVLHATVLNGPTLQVPKLVAELIGLRADLPSPGNGIAFMASGPRVLRVMAVADPSVGATKGSTDALVAVATLTKRLLFSLPQRVRKHLGLGKRPVVAWVVPEHEWERDAPRGPIYLLSSSFPLLPPLPSVEATYSFPRPE